MESGSVFLLIGCGHKPSAGVFFFWHAGAATLSRLSNQTLPTMSSVVGSIPMHALGKVTCTLPWAGAVFAAE
jgi:hypothetical protein